MKIETFFNGIRYTLTNKKLKVGDQVYCIARGRVINNNEFILHDLDFSESMSGFPDNPDTIEDLNYSTFKPYEIRTDKGWSPRESYFKIIKKEKHIENNVGKIKSHKWIEIV
jgi:hypothetical protein